MAIYTKTGDKGSTSLFDGKRVKKYALRVDVYGTFDEGNAQISVAEKSAKNSELKKHLVWLEEKIFHLNAEIATAEDYEKLATKSTLITTTDIAQLEKWIDQYLVDLPEITSFILPGSSLAGAQLHVARTICRRGERRLVELSEEESIRPELKQFVNRLSDCLYVFARVEDKVETEEKMIAEVMKRYHEQINQPQICLKEEANFSQVQLVFSACIAKAQELEVQAALTLVDKAGHVIASYRMKDSLLVSIDVSRKKAYSAVAMKQATSQLNQLVQPGAPFYQLETITNGEIVTFGGGLPIFNKQDQLIGGLGVSGGTAEQDQLIAQTGLERLREINNGR